MCTSVHPYIHTDGFICSSKVSSTDEGDICDEMCCDDDSV